MKDLHGVVRYQNRASIPFFGHCVGKSTEETLTREDAKRLRRWDRHAVRSRKPVQFAITLQLQGAAITFQAVKHPFVGKDGTITGTVSTLCQVEDLARTVTNEQPI